MDNSSHLKCRLAVLTLHAAFQRQYCRHGFAVMADSELTMALKRSVLVG